MTYYGNKERWLHDQKDPGDGLQDGGYDADMFDDKQEAEQFKCGLLSDSVV